MSLLRNKMNFYYSTDQIILSGTRKKFLGVKQYSHFTVCPLLQKKCPSDNYGANSRVVIIIVAYRITANIIHNYK